MKGPRGGGAKAADLRQRAEERLGKRHPSRPPEGLGDAVRLVHELQVHQIELEIQNEELVRSRLEAETALQQYSELYDFAPVGYFTLARDGAIRQVNLTGARLLGMDRSVLVERRLGAFVADTDRPAFNSAIATALEGAGEASCEVALARADAPVHLQLTVSASEGRQEVRAVAVDVTERKKSEEQLRASQKMEAVGRLAGGVAHDFNNMLTVILNRCDFELRSVGEGTPRHNLLELKAAAERAAALTGQLLAFSRKQVLRAEVVDVNESARQMAGMLGTLLGEDILVELALAPDLGRVLVDPSQLDQVILNLGVNARDAMPRGGKFAISTANVELGQAYCQSRGLSVSPGSFVRITVSDTGGGMDSATVAHIFEPFFTTKAKGSGTGLGLATVYGIVQQCGGDITVVSEPERGTTFEVYLPRTDSAQAGRSRTTLEVDDPTRATETILVVEDEDAVLSIAALALESAGYRVLAASSGAEALRVSAQHRGPIHLALSDVVMPGMTGVAFVERLAAVRPETLVLYMSGYNEEALDQHGATGARAQLIGKPFTADGLQRKVREVLDGGTRRRPRP